MIKPQKQRKRHSPHRPHLCLNKQPFNPKLCTMLLMDLKKRKYENYLTLVAFEGTAFLRYKLNNFNNS